MILRFYEWAGSESDVKIELPSSAQTAQETNLIERPIGDLPLSNGLLTVHTRPYEIKTVKVGFKLPPVPEPVQIAK